MVFDAHSDIWTDVTVRRLRGEKDVFRRRHLDRLRKGRIDGAIFVIWADPPNDRRPYDRNLEFMQAIREEACEAEDILAIVKNCEGAEQARAEGKFYAFIGLEGLSGVGDKLERIDEYYAFGARHASLTWNEQNMLATGVGGDPDRGLTELGKKAVRKIQGNHMLLDVSHLNEKSFWDLVSMAGCPVVASHSNCKALCGAPRNLTDDQLRAIGDLGGVVGVNAFGEFIDEDPAGRTAAKLAEHVCHITDLIGVEHVGMGFDFSEFLDRETVQSFSGQNVNPTIGLENASHVPGFVAAIREAGFSGKEVGMISSGNFHRVLEESVG